MKKIVIVGMVIIMICLNVGCETKDESVSDTIVSNSPRISDTLQPSEKTNSEKTQTGLKVLSRSDYTFMNSKNGEMVTDEINESIPGFLDILSVKKQIDDENIYIYLKLRDVPQTVTINQSGIMTNKLEYGWRISFDTDGDNGINFNTDLTHDIFWTRSQQEKEVSIDDSSFNNIVWQHEVSSGSKLIDINFDIDNTTMIFHVEKGTVEELLLIHEDTLFYVITEHNDGDNYFYEILPRKVVN